MNVVPSQVTRARSVGAPITVIKDLNTPLSARKTATPYQLKRMLDTVENADHMEKRPRIIRAACRKGLISARTQDDGLMMPNALTFDQATIDSSGAFLIGELENLDPRLHMPLASVTWMEDIKIRGNITIADDLSSYTVNTFTAMGGVPGSNKSWVGKRAISIPTVGIDNEKIQQRVEPWALTLDWTMFELEQSRKLGRPIDEQKHVALQRKWNYDLDEETYIGDTLLTMNGLLNHSLLTNTGNALTGTWKTATPAQILADVNEILVSTAAASALALMPDTLLLAFPDLALLTSTLISSAGNISVLEFLLRNNIAKSQGTSLRIRGRKWLVGTGVTFGGVAGVGPTATNCMFAYRNEEEYLRIPVVPLLRTNPEFRDIRQMVTYYGRIGQVEMVYPELCARRSNIN